MDRYVAQQRKEVQDIASGYLSASQTNKILEERAKQQAGMPRFGATPKNILGEDNGIGIGVMHDILAEFDTVKKRTEITATPEKPKIEKHIPPLKKVSRKFVEPFQLHLTKIDQYKVVSETKSKLISDGIKIKYNDNAKQDKLKKFKEYIKTELAASGCPDKGPDIGRLRVYATCFEQIIQEFTTFGPLLAEIKAEYDKIINNYQEKEDEFTFLRTKVQKLISQNENRFLLRFEKQKCAELENRIQILETENEKLKKDMIYKLTVYASYLPESILAQQRKTDPAFQNIEVQPFELGKDPLSLKDEAISERDKLIKEKMLEIQELRHIQETEFVPRITKEKIEENLRILEQKYKTFAEQNAQYEAELSEKKERVRTLENQLREKEQQYQFLVAEYSELSESLNKQ
ncbi:Clathrin heavy chain linker domain-containing protein 1 [Boothiomyces sp. JEL0838]|nr:Clathrin heavy chain linker domain-containing protein 1 [Boothiomyces sp. JEL0838]